MVARTFVRNSICERSADAVASRCVGARLVGGLLFLLSELLGSKPLYAQPPHDPDRDVDPAVPTGIVLSAVGSAALVTGGVVYATSPEDIPANPPLEIGNAQRLTGSVFIGLGAGLIAAGVPAMLGGLLGPHEHMSDGRMVAGIVLLGLAAASAGIGTALFVNDDLADADFAASVPWGFGSGFLAVGLPLLVSGSPHPQRPQETYSPPMANASYALFALGGALATGASLGFTIARGLERCQDRVCGEVVVSVALLPIGATMLGTAVPLVALGKRPVL
jgi:MFS family permease